MNHQRILILGAFTLAVTCASGISASPRTETPAASETVVLSSMEYPPALLHKGITSGEVQLLLKISPDAKLADTLVTSFTRRELADYTVGALADAKFRPLLVDNQPVTTLVALTMRFESRGLIVIERHACDPVDTMPGRFAYEPCDPSRLDRPLQPVTMVKPVYARELGQQGIKGRVVLEYYIDESGRVRMPVVNETAHHLLAGLSLAAIEQWQFNPPLSGRKPVLVRVRQAFEFVPEKEG